jgi:hypothetical protein
MRRLAMKIACFVVRAAPAVSKDWARATAREMECIESDWAALRWSLGGVRLLWQPCEPRLASLADVPQAALRCAKEIRKRTVSGSIVCVFEAVWFASLSLRMRNPIQRLGCYLVVVGMLYMALQLLARRGGLSARPDVPTSASAYRLELERQRDFHSGRWFWTRLFMMVPGIPLFSLGGAIAHPAQTRAFATIAAVFIFLSVIAVPLNLRRSNNYQRRIDDLNAAEKNEV